MTTFIDSPISLESLSDDSRKKLTRISEYPLDYNIFLFKGIKDSRKDDEKELIKFRKSVLDNIPKDYGNLVFNGLTEKKDGSSDIEPTTTSRLQDRLLQILILERHRRDIIALNKLLSADPKNTKKIQYIKLNEPLKYEVKSPIYRSFESNKELYESSFRKFAVLQSVEYDFEHVIDENGDYQNDDDLIDAFCTPEVLEFNEELIKNKDKGPDKIEDLVDNSRIARVLIPLAAQAFFLSEDGKADSKDDKSKE